MTKLQFRVLYRQFLFRVIDIELISPQGDMSKLLGQFAVLLILVNIALAASAFALDRHWPSRQALLTAAWFVEFPIIATTMLAVGLFAVLSWDSMYPDARDALVLGPLPVRARTIFLAKTAALATSLGLTVVVVNALAGIVLPVMLSGAEGGILDLLFSLALYRAFAAYWITMIAAGTFILCSVLAVQGLAAYILPRRWFLRVSAFLQMAAFCLFVSVYFLQPQRTPQFSWLPAYWFLGLFQQLNGSMYPALAPLAARAWAGLAIALCAVAAAYGLSYFRTLRKIIEAPDITAGVRGGGWLPPFGNSLETAVAQFSIRTLMRSRQHRVMFAFYAGIGLAIVMLLMKSGMGRNYHVAERANTRLLFSNFVIMTVWIIGVRVVFSMPVALRANWIFRVTEIRAASCYLAAIRRPLFALSVAPVWLASAVIFLWIWPWRPASAHLIVLGLWGIILAYISLYNFQKIPFTCSYLPGKSFFHMAFLAALGVFILIGKGVDFEDRALDDPVSYTKLVAALIAAAALARWRTAALAKSELAIVQFEEQPLPAVLGLGLHRDGVWPVSAPQ